MIPLLLALGLEDIDPELAEEMFNQATAFLWEGSGGGTGLVDQIVSAAIAIIVASIIMGIFKK